MNTQVVYILMGDNGTYEPCAVFAEKAVADARAAKLNEDHEEFGEREWTVVAWSVTS